MKKYYYLFLVIGLQLFSQNLIIDTDLGLGYTNPANKFFPELQISKNATLGFGIQQKDTLNWIQKMNNPITGVLFQITDYGNIEKVGQSFSLMPFVELPIFLKNKRLALKSAIGASYFNKKFDASYNWENKAISTDFTWAFRLGFNYKIYTFQNVNTRFNISYLHHSNGHIQWPNNGLNTLILGINAQLNTNKQIFNPFKTPVNQNNNDYFISTRIGLGKHALSRFNNNTNNVYTFGLTYGKIYNATHKIGLVITYHYYENYYNYIKENKELVATDYPELKNKPFYNSSSYGVFINYEYLMSHFSINTELGITISKPFYKIDYRLNDLTYNKETQDYDIGEAKGTEYILKRLINAKLGMRYYILNMNAVPKHNLFLSVNIVSNLGQADFGEFSMGYIYTFKRKERN